MTKINFTINPNPVALADDGFSRLKRLRDGYFGLHKEALKGVRNLSHSLALMDEVLEVINTLDPSALELTYPLFHRVNSANDKKLKELPNGRYYNIEVVDSLPISLVVNGDDARLFYHIGLERFEIHPEWSQELLTASQRDFNEGEVQLTLFGFLTPLETLSEGFDKFGFLTDVLSKEMPSDEALKTVVLDSKLSWYLISGLDFIETIEMTHQYLEKQGFALTPYDTFLLKDNDRAVLKEFIQAMESMDSSFLLLPDRLSNIHNGCLADYKSYRTMAEIEDVFLQFVDWKVEGDSFVPYGIFGKEADMLTFEKDGIVGRGFYDFSDKVGFDELQDISTTLKEFVQDDLDELVTNKQLFEVPLYNSRTMFLNDLSLNNAYAIRNLSLGSHGQYRILTDPTGQPLLVDADLSSYLAGIEI